MDRYVVGMAGDETAIPLFTFGLGLFILYVSATSILQR